MTATRVPEHLGPVTADEPGRSWLIGPGQALRLMSRQLFAYQAADAGAGSLRPVPDLAIQLPTVDNGDVGEDGRTYRVRLRDGVRWDAQAARDVVAADLVRGLKRVAHPQAAAVREYFVATIEGMAEYCAAYDAEFGHWCPDAPRLAQFQMHHEVAGVTALSAKELRFRLREPAADLLDLLATGYAAAAPREYDYYVPDNPDLYRNSPSCGPYRVDRRRSTVDEFVLEPNPRWDQATDPVRPGPQPGVRVHARPVTHDTRPGSDHTWWYGVLSWAPTAGSGSVGYPGTGLCPYLLMPARPGRPTGERAVREALAHGIDREALAAAVAAAGGLGARAAHAVVPAWDPDASRYDPWTVADPVPGDPAGARRRLAEAGHPDGVQVTVALTAGERYRPVLAALTADLARCGVTVTAAAPAEADVLVCDWAPRWAGDARRDLVHRLWCPDGLPVDRPARPSPGVVELAARALRELDPRAAQRLWSEVDRAALADRTVIPLVTAAWPDTAAAAVASGGWPGRWGGPG